MKYTKKDDTIIIDGISKGLSYSEIAKRLGRSSESVRKRYSRLRAEDSKLKPKKINSQVKDAKSGLEIKNDHVVVNWTTKTVITDLGEFGTYTCSFDMHGAIMRAYSNEYEGKGETQAEIAMRFDFPHAKAVAKYMKYHGMSKSMVGQTDIELEAGLTVEEAVQENIQSLKRKIHKETERRKWKEVQKAAENWWAIHHGVLKPFENHIEKYLPKHKPIKPILKKKKGVGNNVVLVGISDIHYMKVCFDAFGNTIYNRDIARKLLFENANTLINEIVSKYGVPDKFILPIGNDNLHIDNPLQTTTRGTPQANSTEGSYRIELGNYLDMTMTLIETFAQVAPVDVVSMPGNHDLHTSYFLSEALKRIYDNAKDINLIVRYHERSYIKYGHTCFVLSHGDKISYPRTKREVHKLIMSEARQQGVDLNDVKEWVFVIGHLHHEEMLDMGGNTEIITLPSITEEDDWHSDSGYVGSKKRSLLVVYNKDNGKSAVIYAGNN